jgi:hypothetical protein
MLGGFDKSIQMEFTLRVFAHTWIEDGQLSDRQLDPGLDGHGHSRQGDCVMTKKTNFHSWTWSPCRNICGSAAIANAA